MNKLIGLLAAVCLLSGCGQVDQAGAALFGVSKVCVDGVTYLQFTSGAAAQIDQNGRPVRCEPEVKR